MATSKNLIGPFSRSVTATAVMLPHCYCYRYRTVTLDWLKLEAKRYCCYGRLSTFLKTVFARDGEMWRWAILVKILVWAIAHTSPYTDPDLLRKT